MNRYVTLKDVAKKAGTTVATVSYVLNGAQNRYISAELRMRVEQAAKELHYVKSSAASSLKGKQRKIIAVLIPQFYNEFFTDMVLQIEQTADQYGYILSTCNTFDDPARESEILLRMQSQRVDGYLVVPSSQGEENTKSICERGIPIVFMDRYMNAATDNAYYILSESYRSVATATQELLDAGHTKIAYIGWKVGYGGLEERERAYRETMQAHGISPEYLVMYQGDITEENGARFTQQLLDEHPEITALVYASNVQARGGVGCLAQKGIQLGKDLSVTIVGCPKWAMTGENNITCIDLGGTEIGERAAQLLFNIIHQDEPRAHCKEMVPCRIIRGTSVKQLAK